jgi:phosphatidylglycerol:prolipoprotein diacylglycerol transferase
MVGGFLGARLLHVLWEERLYYASYPNRIFQFWNGGFVFYGGAILATLCGFLYVRQKKISFFEWADFFTSPLNLGYGLGRIACWYAGCCYGGLTNWSFLERYPTQLATVLWEVLVFLLMNTKKVSLYLDEVAGRRFLVYILFHTSFRFFIEFFRDDPRGEKILIFSISQIISVVLFWIVLLNLSLKQASRPL